MPESADELNMACFRVVKALDELEVTVPAAIPLAKRMLRVAGRVIIDTGTRDAKPEDWGNTEEMALLWIDEALRPLGYTVRPLEGGGRPELPDPSVDWH